MEPALMEQLRVDDPMHEPELQLDGNEISSIQLLMQPPVTEDASDEENFYYPLDQFANLIKFSMTSARCHSLEGFPHLPLLRWLLLGDNDLATGFEALAEADLQSLVHLDLSGNKIADLTVLKPLESLGNLRHLSLSECDAAQTDDYRERVFALLPQLTSVDGMDREGDAVDVEEEEDEYSSGEEDYPQHAAGGEDEGEYEIDDGEVEQGQDVDSQEDENEYDSEGSGSPRHQDRTHEYESEDIGSQDENDEDDEEEDIESDGQEESDSELEDQENRPMTGGKTTGGAIAVDDDDEEDGLEEGEDDDEEEEEDDDDELDEDDDEDEEEYAEGASHAQHPVGQDSDDEDEEEEEEGPGLAYLIQDDLPDENDDEFEPVNEVEEDSDISDSDEDDFGSSAAPTTTTISSSTTTTNGTHAKRPRSPQLPSSGTFDDLENSGVDGSATGGFDVDGDGTNGFGMASFDGPATFDDESGHDSKRPRT